MNYKEAQQLAIEKRPALRRIVDMSHADGAVRYEEGVRYGVAYRTESRRLSV